MKKKVKVKESVFAWKSNTHYIVEKSSHPHICKNDTLFIKLEPKKYWESHGMYTIFVPAKSNERIGEELVKINEVIYCKDIDELASHMDKVKLIIGIRLAMKIAMKKAMELSIFVRTHELDMNSIKNNL